MYGKKYAEYIDFYLYINLPKLKNKIVQKLVKISIQIKRQYILIMIIFWTKIGVFGYSDEWLNKT